MRRDSAESFINDMRRRLEVQETMETPMVRSGMATLFLHEEDSDIAGYEKLLTSPANGVETVDGVAVTSGSGEVVIDEYITDPGGMGITTIPAGTWNFATFGKVSNTAGLSEIVIRVYKRSVGGTETELFNLSTGEIDSTDVASYEVDYVAPSFAVSETDRLLVKYFAKTTSAAAITVSLYYEGALNYSHIHTPMVGTVFTVTARPHDLVGAMLALPELRGLWFGSSVDENGRLMDLSGQGRHLTNNNAAPRAILGSGTPYATLNGTTQYFSRADEAGLDITGALTIGGFFYTTSLVAIAALICKDNSSASQRAYTLSTLNGNVFMNTFPLGTTASIVNLSSTNTIGTGEFFFAAGRFTPSAELAVLLNGIWTKSTSGIPAALFNSSAALTIGALANPSSYLPGRLGACFVCAAALPDSLLEGLHDLGRPLYGTA